LIENIIIIDFIVIINHYVIKSSQKPKIKRIGTTVRIYLIK
jgi:hypothetical protein